MTDFASFIAPLRPDEFMADYFGKRPVHIRRGDAPAPDVLPWGRFNDILSLTPYWSDTLLKVILQNRPAMTQHYCETIETHDGPVMRANPAKVRALLGMGASLVANKVQVVCPSVHAVARAIEQQLTARVGANVYCSFKNVQAFRTHFDLHDVFAIQTEGEKVWRVWEARADNPTQPVAPGEEGEKFLEATRGKLLFEAHMKPGDVIYLPRGWYHDALAQTQASLHVSFNVSPMKGLGLFKLLEQAGERESLLRAYLPDPREDGGRALAASLSEIGERVAAILKSPAFAMDVMNAQRGVITDAPGYALPDAPKPAFYANSGRSFQIVHRDENHFLASGGAELPLGPAYPAVEWLLKQRTFSFEDLAARYAFIPREALRDILRRLTSAGFIAEAPMIGPKTGAV
ncbi:MAG: cupin domain-containing protein [Hyphomonadaceae bacterium]